MYHHVVVQDTESTKLYKNKSREDVLVNYVCPFINREVTLHRGKIFNMVFPISMRTFYTDLPITTDWPVDLDEMFSDKDTKKSIQESDVFREIEVYLGVAEYTDRVIAAMVDSNNEITEELFKEAIMLIETGDYVDLRKRLAVENLENSAFFICPFGVEDVDHNYEYVIKPTVRSHNFQIERADEIASTGLVTELITNAIVRSRIIIADLTNERPNCYYEVGFAHSLGKPVIILARVGSTRHFDISVRQWNFWEDYKDLKPKFEKSFEGVLKEIGIY